MKRLPLLSSALGAALLVACAQTPSAPARHPANPYRDQVAWVEPGRAAFNQSCANCHGVDAEPTPEAPDLRRLNSFCNRLQQDSLKHHCLSDVDQYFMQSVLEGKVRAGLVHMPPWKGVLTTDTIWSIRTFLESRKAPPLPKAPEINSAPAS